MIGTHGTSGCEASAPQVGHQRPSTQRHPASQWTAKRPESSHTPRQGPARVWLGSWDLQLGTREHLGAGWSCLEAPPVRVPVLAPSFSATADAEQPRWGALPASHCSGMAGRSNLSTRRHSFDGGLSSEDFRDLVCCQAPGAAFCAREKDGWELNRGMEVEGRRLRG